MREELKKISREFVFSDLPYQWTEAEKELINKIFTNSNRRVFFIYNVLPANMIAVLLAIYSRLKNVRGLRGIFVDNFVPHILSGFLSECANEYEGNPVKFLKDKKITKLNDFINYSAESKKAYLDFFNNLSNSDYLSNLSQSKKMSNFLSTWLDKYGHNSIARPAMLYFCFEQISILAAKSVQWTRPGAGYIELSTRYVDMRGKDVYPVDKELELYGVDSSAIKRVIDKSFDIYRELQGENFDGPFPKFLSERYQKEVPAESLEQGVIGETCDVLGNLLPASTLVSLGVGMSGEALPGMVKHLKLDNTPENHCLAEMILEESGKVGANQFLRHLDLSDWEEKTAAYLSLDNFEENDFLPNRDFTEKVLLNSFKHKTGFGSVNSWEEVISQLQNLTRSAFDKLPREFELATVVFDKLMSFRSWRDLHRMGLATHRRGYLSPKFGFYQYNKPSPEILNQSFAELHQLNQQIYDQMTGKNVPAELKQYVLALGNMVPFTYAANLRQMEFSIWQRSKPSVNHEVRQLFLQMENQIRQNYPWWEKISRANTTEAYIFARGDSDMPLKK